MLKPKLWNRFLIHRTSQLLSATNMSKPQPHLQNMEQSSLSGGVQDEEKSLGDQQLLLTQHQTITRNLEWCVADAGLFNSRRFRMNWSMHRTAFTFTQLASSSGTSSNTCVQLLSPQVTCFSATSPSCDASQQMSKLNVLKDNCRAYLHAQLDLTEFNYSPPTSGGAYSSTANTSLRLPHLATKSGNDLIRQLCELSQQLRNTIGNLLFSFFHFTIRIILFDWP